jgi:hypothetical protein
MRQLKHDRALEWVHTRLITLGASYCAGAHETLGKTLTWVVEYVDLSFETACSLHNLHCAYRLSIGA